MCLAGEDFSKDSTLLMENQKQNTTCWFCSPRKRHGSRSKLQEVRCPRDSTSRPPYVPLCDKCLGGDVGNLQTGQYNCHLYTTSRPNMSSNDNSTPYRSWGCDSIPMDVVEPVDKPGIPQAKQPACGYLSSNKLRNHAVRHLVSTSTRRLRAHCL